MESMFFQWRQCQFLHLFIFWLAAVPTASCGDLNKVYPLSDAVRPAVGYASRHEPRGWPLEVRWTDCWKTAKWKSNVALRLGRCGEVFLALSVGCNITAELRTQWPRYLAGSRWHLSLFRFVVVFFLSPPPSCCFFFVRLFFDHFGQVQFVFLGGLTGAPLE